MAIDSAISEPADSDGGRSGKEELSELYGERYWLHFWLRVWVMIIVAGAVFGSLQFPIAGTVAGAFIAAFLAPPFVMSAVILTWACWLSRLAVLTAAAAGAATGVFATAMTWDSVFAMEFEIALVWAGFIGGLGGVFGGAIYMRRYPLPRTGESTKEQDIWRYSLRDLFVRFTVVSMLVAGWCLFLSELLK
jgi:hypothetical protein